MIAPVPKGTRFHDLQDALRAAYLRAMPVAALRVLDAPLRRVVAAARRAAAAPLYLRQPCAVLVGTCQGEPTRVVLWGKPNAPRALLDLLFDAPPGAAWGPPRTLPSMLHDMPRLAGDADVLLVETTPALAGVFRRRGFLIVPDSVFFGADVRTLRETLAHPSESLASDFRRARRSQYRVELRPRTPDDLRVFFERYIVPHAQARFGGAALTYDPAFFTGVAPVAALVAILRPGETVPDAMAMVVIRGRTAWFLALGTLDGDPDLARLGALPALYQAVIAFAEEQGARWIDCGRCRPWRADGVVGYKWKWGFRPMPSTTQTLEHGVKILRPASAVARRLVARGLLVRDGRWFTVLGRDRALPPG